MSAFLDYLLKLSISFGLIALFYHFALRKLTFYGWNRCFLLLYSALCFVLPFVNINTAIDKYPSTLPARPFVQSVPSITHTIAPGSAITSAPGAIPTSPDATDWIAYLWIAGVVIMILRLLLHLRSYQKIKAQSWLVSDDGVNIYHFDLDISPFSFGNSIFYNPHLHEPDDLQDMILHEFVHVRQRHSVDVVWSEILCIFNWYNPFVWVIRSAIRQNLEYIADQKVLENHADTKSYQYLLLKAAVGPELALVNQFGYHSLKQRIVMMNKNASPRIMMACFLFMLPLLAVMLAAFRDDLPEKKTRQSYWFGSKEISKRQPKDLLHLAGILLDSETGKPVTNLPLQLSHDDQFIKIIRTDKDGYFFAELPFKSEVKVVHSYQLEYQTDEYQGFTTGKSYQADFEYGGGFNVHFLNKRNLRALMPTGYGVASKPFYDTYHPVKAKAELKSYLLENLPPFKAEMQLKVEYIKLKQWPKQVITLYKGGYFDREKKLIGYDGETKLYLNGKAVTYQQINAAFKDYPYMLTEAQEKRMPGFGVCEQIVYLTFPLHRDAPPAALVKGNVQMVNAKTFDLGRLKKEAYLLDGFRQVYGASSNLIPLKVEIRKVVLLKGQLARYYDPALNEIWWIETRPVDEVFERPDFASK